MISEPSGAGSAPQGAAPLRLRRAVRAILLTPDREVLLVRFEFPTATVWALPGGGIDEGEDDLTTLRRELREELGLIAVDIGPQVWVREHVIPMTTGHDGQRDHVHLVHTARFHPEPEIGWDALRSEYVHELRWWSIDEIAAMRWAGERPTVFAPRRLAALLRELVEHGPPAVPIDTGV